MERMSRVGRRMGLCTMLPSLWLPWTPGRPNGAYSNSFPGMKFESVGFPFEEGPVRASRSHNIDKHAVCIRYYRVSDTVLPSFLPSGTSPPAVPSSPLRCAHHLGSQGAPLPLLNLSFRTQTKGRCLLKIFPDPSRGRVGTPSPKHPHVNVCACPSYTVSAFVS